MFQDNVFNTKYSREIFRVSVSTPSLPATRNLSRSSGVRTAGLPARSPAPPLGWLPRAQASAGPSFSGRPVSVSPRRGGARPALSLAPGVRGRSRGRCGRVRERGALGALGAAGGRERSGLTFPRDPLAAPPPPSHRLPAPVPRATASPGRGDWRRGLQLLHSLASSLGGPRGSATPGLGLGTPGVPNPSGRFRRLLQEGWWRPPRMSRVAPPESWCVSEAAWGRGCESTPKWSTVTSWGVYWRVLGQWVEDAQLPLQFK